MRVRITSNSPKNKKEKLELARLNSDKIKIASERDMSSSRKDPSGSGSRNGSNRGK